MSDTILTLREAKAFLHLEDDDAERDQVIEETLLPAIDDIVEQYAGWVVKRDRTFTLGPRQHGQAVVLPGTRVLTIKSASSAAGALDITGMRVDDAGIVHAAPGGQLPLGEWTLTAETGIDPVPHALRMAASELLFTAWENYRAAPGAAETRPFVVSYRAEAWLLPFTNGATFA